MARFQRTQPPPPQKSHYRQYRELVRQDFKRCCAHCLRHEYHLAGTKMYVLDHFRPKAKHLFPHLINDFYNLYYCCWECNLHKMEKWCTPTQESQGISFVDLCKDNFEDHYRQLDSGEWEALTPSAEYTIKELQLNHEELVVWRRDVHNRGEHIDKNPHELP